ncbi:hypothetical protein EI42_06403 [Thermosporothrix hazakensis]|jgi:hypothetical protein|uniref:Uncharacterized protein n=1 Tax=Thermosporothrix hazakensis TaxID=644383 RepID=A0A326TRE9_THEHA|nr:hypothetical protein EI42_06403 [Thermosporothrix hazakensis]
MGLRPYETQPLFLYPQARISSYGRGKALLCSHGGRKRGPQTGGAIGKVLQYQGRVSRHDDPHQDLLGISRSELLKEAVSQLLLSFLEVIEQ